MRNILLTLALLLLPAILALAACQSPPAPPAPPESTLIPYSQWLAAGGFGDPGLDADSPADRAVRQVLDEEIKNVDIDNSPFDRVIVYLQEHTATNISTNWKALEPAGITPTTPVTTHLSRVSFRKALTTILSEIGGGTANLGYTIDDGIIVISTRDDLNSARYQIVCVYNIRDLLAEPRSDPPSSITPGTATQPAPDDTRETTRREAVNDVIETIKSSVAPDSWRDAGGTIGSIRELNGQLIVNQTFDNQHAIRDLLAQLRECRILRITVQSRLVLLDPDACTRLLAKLPSTILDAAQFAQFTPALRAADPVTLADESATIFNGDATNLPFTHPRTYISAYQANPAPGRTAEFLKIFSTVQPGLLINNAIAMSADRRWVVVKTTVITRQLEAMQSIPAPATPPELRLTVETPLLLEQRSSTLTSIPDGRTALIPGPLVNANFPRQDPTAKPAKRLLLILTPSIMIDKSAPGMPPPVSIRNPTCLGDEIPIKQAFADSSLVAIAQFTAVTPSSALSPYGVRDYTAEMQLIKPIKAPRPLLALNVDFALNSEIRKDIVPHAAQEWLIFAQSSNRHWIATKMLLLTPETRPTIEQELAALSAATATQPATAPATRAARAPYVPRYTDEQAEAVASRIADLKYPLEMDAACTSLGIAPLRQDSMMLCLTGGGTGTETYRLSPGYTITLQFQLWPKYAIDNVVVSKWHPK